MKLSKEGRRKERAKVHIQRAERLAEMVAAFPDTAKSDLCAKVGAEFGVCKEQIWYSVKQVKKFDDANRN